MTGYLLDTNVLSEMARKRPDARVRKFFHENRDMWISVMVVEELGMGIELLPSGRRRDQLSKWLEQLVVDFRFRMLPIELAEVRWSSRLRSQANKSGFHLKIPDALIAATALTNDLRLVTRNVRDFVMLDMPMLDPWKTL